MISSYLDDQRALGRGSTGGKYWMRQDDPTSTLWWYAEHPRLGWATVYHGNLINDRDFDRWEGTFVDVPKGLTCGHGMVNWRSLSFRGDWILEQTTVDSGYGDRFIAHLPIDDGVPDAGVARVTAGFSRNELSNLTGVWIGDDHGTYYIREISQTGQIAWVGEHPQAAEGLTEGEGNTWVNVLLGGRNGSTINAEWSDVPKGGINSAGILNLNIVNPNFLRITRKTGGFGGNSFTRVSTLSVTLTFVSITVLDQQDPFFEGDEPYFYALVALMDGRTVDLRNRGAATIDFSNSLVAPTFASQVGPGSPPVILTSMPPVTIPIAPVAGDDGTHVVLGIALRGGEQDASSDAWRADHLTDWVTTGGDQLQRSLQAGMASFARDIARWHATLPGPFEDTDEIFGLATATFTYPQLAAMLGTTVPLTFALRGSDVAHTVAATLTVTGARGICSP